MYNLVERIVLVLKKIIPAPVARPFLKPYHFALALFFALWYQFPARSMTVIGVTGTKGKSSVSEMLYEIFNAAGHKTALISGIHFAYPEHDEPNLFKMTMPGRGFVQKLLSDAKTAGATIAIVEITSEAVPLSRHHFLALNGLVVTNIQKEHIEAHGSFANYVAAKKKIVDALSDSPKQRKVLVVNGDDPITNTFTADGAEKHTFRGAQTPGEFEKVNQRAALTIAQQFGIERSVAENAISNMPPIRGRKEYIKLGQDFDAVVDYAHTPDSLTALYDAFKEQKKICVLGNTGGGRDTWKRPEMGAIAEEHCDTVILTNEDPYDEDPEKIVNEMVQGMRKKPLIIMDRRTAIRKALSLATSKSAVLISGKGTDPYIMEANGAKTPWSDAEVVREELEKLLKKKV